MITYCCKSCGNPICSRTALYGDGQCKSCANIQKIKDGVYDTWFKSLKGKGNPSYKNGLPKCQDCGKQLTNYDTKFCSVCFPKSRKGKARSGKLRIGKSAPGYKDGHTLKQNHCVDCDKKIRWNAIRCVTCFGISNSGTNNSNYVHGNGYKRYPLVFNNRLKNKIRKRQNYTCQNCKISENKYGQKLSIHHIDYNKENCAEINLITVCNLCNVKANYNRDYWFAYYTYIMENK